MNNFNISSGQGQQWNIADDQTAQTQTNAADVTSEVAELEAALNAQDSVQQSEGDAGTAKSGTFTALPGQPQLEQPDANAPPFTQLTQSNFANLPQPMTPTQFGNTQFQNEVGEMVQNGQINDEQAADLKFGFNNPTNPKTVADKAIQSQVAQIVNQVKEENPGATPTPDPQAFDQEVNQAYETAFAAAVKQAVGQMNLPPDQAKALIAKTMFAHMNPNQVSRSSGDLASKLEQQVAQQMIQNYGLPSDWQFTPQTQDFNDNLAETYNEAFNSLLGGDTSNPTAQAILAANPQLAAQLKNLSPTQLAQLQYMHYNPGAQYPEPDGSMLQDLNTQLQGLLTSSLSTELGYPSTYQLPIDNTSNNAVIQGSYREAFFENLNTYAQAQTPPLTDAQIAAIKYAFDNPTDTSVTAQVKQIVAQLQTQAIASIKDEFGLPDNWTPPVGPITGGAVGAQSAAIALNGINNSQEMITNLENIVLKTPDSPMKSQLLNLLKEISQALSRAKEQVYNMESQDSLKSKQLGKAQLDESLNKIHKQQEAIDAAKSSGKPALGIISKVMEAVGPMAAVLAVVIAVCTMGTGTAIAIAVACAAVVYTVADAIVMGVTGTGIIGQAMNAIADAVAAALPPGAARQAVTIAIEMVLIVVVTALVIWANPMIGLTVGMQAAGQAVEQSGVIQDLVGAMGGNQMAQQLTAMVLVAAVTTAASIGASIYAIYLQVFKLTANIAEQVGETTQKLTTSLAKMAQISEELAQKIAARAGQMAEKGVDLSINLGGLGVQAVQMTTEATIEAIQLQSQLQQAKQALQKGELEADMQTMEAMIKLLQKLITMLMASITNSGNVANEIQTIQKNMWSNMSQISTNISNSGAA